MNIGWLKIIGATLFELVWVTGLKYAELPWQWGVTALSILGSSYCLITAGTGAHEELLVVAVLGAESPLYFLEFLLESAGRVGKRLEDASDGRHVFPVFERSEERRVGKECRSRWGAGE